MKRFFLDIRHRDRLIVDEEGSSHIDLDAALRHAVAAAREMIGADVQNGTVDLDQAILIRNDIGAVVGEVGFATVFNIVGPNEASRWGPANADDGSPPPFHAAAIGMPDAAAGADGTASV